ncbi:MAG: hypothetical protein CVV35_00820 [Methanomicrobiales archaeon HGW-Methanomicrobiales-6]|jgi:hypothetical protein|nr:MAG: hypothetical protein CVV35_00820 [Methanomicrobiales archaeon HGW-Methanomicrobiales-6]
MQDSPGNLARARLRGMHSAPTSVLPHLVPNPLDRKTAFERLLNENARKMSAEFVASYHCFADDPEIRWETDKELFLREA